MSKLQSAQRSLSKTGRGVTPDESGADARYSRARTLPPQHCNYLDGTIGTCTVRTEYVTLTYAVNYIARALTALAEFGGMPRASDRANKVSDVITFPRNGVPSTYCPLAPLPPSRRPFCLLYTCTNLPMQKLDKRNPTADQISVTWEYAREQMRVTRVTCTHKVFR